MSQFSVLVITDSRPSDEELGAVLQPWHEFECTGKDDEYVIDVDETAEALEAYSKAKETCLRSPDGAIHSYFDDKGEWRKQFSKEAEHGGRERYIPPGYEEIEVSASSLETAADWISGYYGWEVAGKGDGDAAKYGYIQVDGDGNVVKCINRTNPNKKWDWWVVGGRWSGLLRVKPAVDPVLGRKGLLGSCRSDAPNRADQALVGELDLEPLRNEERATAAALWDRVKRITDGLPAIIPWETVRAETADHNAAREAYWDQPALKALKAEFPDSWSLDDELEAYSMTLEAYCQLKAGTAISTFAVVKDGKWYERGEMGWWGTVHDEKDRSAWVREFSSLLDGLPDTACLTVVDCHI